MHSRARSLIDQLCTDETKSYWRQKDALLKNFGTSAITIGWFVKHCISEDCLKDDLSLSLVSDTDLQNVFKLDILFNPEKIFDPNNFSLIDSDSYRKTVKKLNVHWANDFLISSDGLSNEKTDSIYSRGIDADIIQISTKSTAFEAFYKLQLDHISPVEVCAWLSSIDELCDHRVFKKQRISEFPNQLHSELLRLKSLSSTKPIKINNQYCLIFAKKHYDMLDASVNELMAGAKCKQFVNLCLSEIIK